MARTTRNFILKAAAVAAWIAATAPVFAAGPLSLSTFRTETGLTADDTAVQRVWNSLEAMGTTQFLGGMLGGFKLDESSMIAGALSIGASEFDSLLNGGGLNVSSLGAGEELSRRMTSAAGIDLSYLTGSFTAGGGGTMVTQASVLSGGGASSGSGSCDATVASGMAQTGKAYVDKIVTAATSKEFGFSEVKGIGAGGGGSGFAALGCLDKLFQNAGSDILFKPPSLGNLTTQLQNWTCGDAMSVQDQLAGAFGGGEIFQTAALGGFFPSKTFGDANDGSPDNRPGQSGDAARIFGGGFADFNGGIKASPDIKALYR